MNTIISQELKEFIDTHLFSIDYDSMYDEVEVKFNVPKNLVFDYEKLDSIFKNHSWEINTQYKWGKVILNQVSGIVEDHSFKKYILEINKSLINDFRKSFEW